MAKCPYCLVAVKIEDFFEDKEKALIGTRKKFNGESFLYANQSIVTRMWVCPHCESILGFSESKL